MKIEKNEETVLAVTRGLVGLVAVANLAAQAAGLIPIEVGEDEVYAAVSGVVGVAALVWCWWRNNSVTKAAQDGDVIMRAEKMAGKLGEEEE